MSGTDIPPAPAILDYSTPVAQTPISRLFDTLGWAVYLGTSWTWCIGMFLPVLLVREYGVLGWWEFALPNVIGAAAMGWVVRSRRHSEELVAAHRIAVRAFSHVTLAFHVFFVAWIAHMSSRVAHSLAEARPHYFEAALIWPVLAMLPFVAMYVLVGRRADRAVATVVFGISVLVAISGLTAGWLDPLSAGQHTLNPEQVRNLACLIPVMIFGFALCPYLDQTFHRGCQRAGPGQAGWAFGLGFGLFFLAMIVMTLGYVDIMEPSRLEKATFLVARAVPVALLVHLFTQAGLTMNLHLRDPTLPGRHEISGAVIGTGLISWAIGTLAWLAVLAVGAGAMIWPGFLQGEFVYRGFLSFYALIFPAYVLICMKPWRHDPSPPTARQWTLFFAAVVVAAPMYWAAFIDNEMIWLLPALGWVGLMWLVPPRGKSASIAG